MAEAGIVAAQRPGRSRTLVGAGLWSLVLAAVAVRWAADPASYPFGPADPSAILSALGGMAPEVAAPVAAAVGLAAIVLAVGLLRRADRAPSTASRPLVVGVWILAA